MSIARTRLHARNSVAHSVLVPSTIFGPVAYDRTIQASTDFAAAPPEGEIPISRRADPEHLSQSKSYARQHPRLYRLESGSHSDIRSRAMEDNVVQIVGAVIS